jgi:hypothetical protein
MPVAQYGQRGVLGVSEKNLYLNISDQVKKFPKYRRELISRLGSKPFGKDEVNGPKYEWSARDNRPMEAEVVVDATNSATVVHVGTPGVFNVDDIFQASNGCQFLVTSVAGGTEVTFEKLSGTQAAMVVGETLSIVSGGTAHGKDADNMVTTGYEDYYNYVGNFEDVIELDDIAHAAMLRGEEDQGELVARKQMELTEKLQRAIVMGIRTRSDVNKRTTMGGIKNMIDTYVPTHKLDFGASWTSDLTVEGKLDAALDVIAQKAFEKPVIYCSPKFMTKFKYIQDDTFRAGESPTGRGIGVVKTYRSHTFGDVDVVQLQGMGHLMDDFVAIGDESTIGYKAHKGLAWHTYPLAKTGQSFKWQVAGIYTFKMEIPESWVYFYNLGL